MNTPEYFGIIRYTWRINESGIEVLDCHQNVYLENKKLTELPFQFGIVDCDFDCSWNKLETLKGCPEIVKGNFWCESNQLTSLEFGTKEVRGEYYVCWYNNLKTLKGAPRNFKGDFNCDNNNLPEDENTYEKYIEKMRKLKLQKILEVCNNEYP